MDAHYTIKSYDGIRPLHWKMCDGSIDTCRYGPIVEKDADLSKENHKMISRLIVITTVFEMSLYDQVN